VISWGVTGLWRLERFEGEGLELLRTFNDYNSALVAAKEMADSKL
jgi:hypothetical protein